MEFSKQRSKLDRNLSLYILEGRTEIIEYEQEINKVSMTRVFITTSLKQYADTILVAKIDFLWNEILQFVYQVLVVRDQSPDAPQETKLFTHARASLEPIH